MLGLYDPVRWSYSSHFTFQYKLGVRQRTLNPGYYWDGDPAIGLQDRWANRSYKAKRIYWQHHLIG